jgi:hypothetical protein
MTQFLLNTIYYLLSIVKSLPLLMYYYDRFHQFNDLMKCEPPLISLLLLLLPLLLLLLLLHPRGGKLSAINTKHST